MVKKWLLLLILAIPAYGQISNPGIIAVTTAPSGACSSSLPDQQTYPGGLLYSCQSGTWTQIAGGGGSGTVTSFSAGNLAPLFTASVATATTTPALTFTITAAAANTVFGNFTGGSAAPTFSAAPVFSAANLTNFPTFNQNTTGNAATATNISTNGTANQVWGMNSGASAQGWQTVAAGGVSSVSNSDSSLTISPTTGSVVASINLANPNVFTATQTAPSFAANGTANGFVDFTATGVSPGAAPSNSVQVEAPSSVTAYRLQWPSGACSGLLNFTNVAGVVSSGCIATPANLSSNIINPVTYGAFYDGLISNNVAWTASSTTINVYQSIAINPITSTIGSGQSGTPTCAATSGTGPGGATCSAYLDANGGCHVIVLVGGQYTSGGAPAVACTATGGTPSNFNVNLIGPTFQPSDAGSTKKIYAVGQIVTQVNGILNMAVQSMSGATYVSPNQITVTTAPTISCSGTTGSDTCQLTWCHDDTSAHNQAAFVAVSTPGAVVAEPPGNSCISGPINQITFPHPSAPLQITGATVGQPTQWIPTPDFVFTNKSGTGILYYDPYAGGGNTLFAQGDYVNNITVVGSGLKNIPNAIPNNSCIIWAQQFNGTNFYLNGWGSNTSSLIGGFCLNGVTLLVNSGANGAGFNDCVVQSNSVGGSNVLVNSYCGQSSGDGFLLSGGTAQVTNGSQLNTTVINGSGAILNSSQSLFGGVTVTTGTWNSESDTATNSTAATAGVVHISKGAFTQFVLNGGTLSADKTSFSNSGGFAGLEISTTAAPSTFSDGGGNTYIGGTSNVYYQGTGTTGGNFVSPDEKIGTCTGTATSATTIYLYGMGGSLAGAPTTTCTGTTLLGGRVMDHSGKLRTLTVNLGTGGVSSSSGVFTVYKNGSATTLTCTTGTTTNCFDVTNAHEVTFAAGDVIAIGFTTQLTDTLANVTAGVYANWK